MTESRYWPERSLHLAAGRIARAKEQMQKMVASPVLRRANTSDLAQAAIFDPASVTPQGRDMLVKYLKDTYGEAASILEPYILNAPVGDVIEGEFQEIV